MDDKKTFEECYEVISSVIKKASQRWQLKAISWMSFEDVEQIVKLHIFNKWHLWDQSKALEPWVMTITMNQIRNLIRNNYSNYSRPCLKCEYASDCNGCFLTESREQDSSCADYHRWEVRRKSAYEIKFATSFEANVKDNDHRQSEEMDYSAHLSKINEKLKDSLAPNHYTVYRMIFIDGIGEEEVAKVLGLRTSEAKRKAGYKQIKNIKKIIIKETKKIIEELGL